jgi:hypothetical protein
LKKRLEEESMPGSEGLAEDEVHVCVFLRAMKRKGACVLRTSLSTGKGLPTSPRARRTTSFTTELAVGYRPAPTDTDHRPHRCDV